MSNELEKNAVGKVFKIGNEYACTPIRAGGQYFSFRSDQQMFLAELMKSQGNIEKSCKAAGWEREQAEKFFASKKWRLYKEKILAMGAIRNGDLRDEWWEFMVNGMVGKSEFYEGVCELCHQDYKIKPQVAEQYRTDEMKLEMQCSICRAPVALEHKEEEFRPSREQVQCAAELGARIEPKREHISHSFSDETYSFILDGKAE